MHKAIALAASLAVIACLVMASGFSTKKNDIQTSATKVVEEYQDNFSSTCAIGTSTGDGSINGTGILLRSGIIITNMHVIDANRNGMVDDSERDKTVWFYGDSKIQLQGVVELSSNGFIGRDGVEYDLAFIRVENPPKSSVTLVTADEYFAIGVGEELYALGFPEGMDPMHMTTGVMSTPVEERFGRSSVPIWFGNSGGPLFLKSSGKLIGINTRIRIDWHRGTVPAWSEFMPAHRIISFLLSKNKLSYLSPAADKKYY